MRPINADALTEKLEMKVVPINCSQRANIYISGYNAAMLKARSEISQLGTVGKARIATWITGEINGSTMDSDGNTHSLFSLPLCYCANCESAFSKRYNFCPDCGAKMINPGDD